ncbi:hypothetical protein MMC07_002972 [Pseudocyphellaria aurata]|nr:hypothetical protein [Pseudocyphellaria aurata]
MPDGETTEDHRKWQQEEAEIVEKDKQAGGDHSNGLFRGCFVSSSRRHIGPIRDNQDGVERCPRCTWELEDGYCVSCEYQVTHPDTEGSVGSESPSISYFTDEEAARHRHNEEMRDFFSVVRPELGSEQGGDIEGYSGLSGLSNDSDEDASAIPIAAQRDVWRRMGARGSARPPSSGRIRHAHAHNRYSETGTSDADFGDTDDFSAEDDEAGSLDDFVVNDVDEQPPFGGHSPRSSHYDTDEVSGIVDQFRTYSSEEEEEGEEHGHGDDERVDQTSDLPDNPPFSPIYLESDSDEGPMIRSRRNGYERTTVSPRPSSSDGSEILASAEHFTRSRGDRRHRNDTTSGRRLSTAHRRTSHEGSELRGGLRFHELTGVAIDMGSESDSSPPVQHQPRRRRAVSRRILSDDDDDDKDEALTASVDSNPTCSRPSSSGTATVGHASPTHSSPREHDLRTADHSFHTASPIVINSSPTSHENPQFSWPFNPNDGHRITRPSAARSGNDHSRRPSSLANRLEQRRRLLQAWSPRRPPNQESSTQTHHPTSSRVVINDARGEAARYQQIVRDRTARKTERQQAKQDHRRRERDRANASGLSRPLASPDASEVMDMDGGVQFVNRHRLGQG